MIRKAGSFRFQHVIVGSGAGGATAFATIASSGRSVALIEEGARFLPQDFQRSVTEITLRAYRFAGINPILGRPVIPFGEGRCLGGSTEINGGLFWRTPKSVRDAWVSQNGLEVVFGPRLDEHFETLESRLGVARAVHEIDTNRDSEKLRVGANRLGWEVQSVPRLAPSCSNSNRCGSGCPTGAKQSMSLTLIPDGVAAGGVVYSQMRVERVRRLSPSVLEVIASDLKTQESFTIQTSSVIFAGGVTQTPMLLHQSGIGPRSSEFCFHTNLKVLAEFEDDIHAANGTIFTWQIQEFIDKRLLMMATNLNHEYLAMAFSHLGWRKLQDLITSIDKLGLFTVQVAPFSRGQVVVFRGQSFLFHRLSEKDFELIRMGIVRLCEALFASGARRVHLPIEGSDPAKNLSEVIQTLNQTQPKSFVATSVHGMSSCAMGTNQTTSSIRPDGSVWGHKNIYVMDASALPSWTIESPQGSIMAMTRLLARELVS